MPEPKDHPTPPPPGPKGPPPPPHHDLPPHVMKELLEMREKIGRLEGMMELLLKKME
jgi:hypothetical protein